MAQKYSQFVIHDLDEQQAACLPLARDAQLLAAAPPENHCVGCFGCWLKTPGRCMISDRFSVSPQVLSETGQLLIISRLVYGGYSPDVKAVLDRSIGYLLPYFRILNGEMHHVVRYDNPFRLSVHFYGGPVSAREEDIARRLVAGNALNFGAGRHEVAFYASPAELEVAAL